MKDGGGHKLQGDPRNETMTAEMPPTNMCIECKLPNFSRSSGCTVQKQELVCRIPLRDGLRYIIHFCTLLCILCTCILYWYEQSLHWPEHWTVSLSRRLYWISSVSESILYVATCTSAPWVNSFKSMLDIAKIKRITCLNLLHKSAIFCSFLHFLFT